MILSFLYKKIYHVLDIDKLKNHSLKFPLQHLFVLIIQFMSYEMKFYFVFVHSNTFYQIL